MAGASDGSIYAWDMRNPNSCLFSVTKHASYVWQVAFHPTEPDFLMTCSNDGNLFLWDFNTLSKSSAQFGGKYQSSFEVASVIVGSNPDALPVYPIINTDLSINSFDINPNLNAIVTASDNELLTVKSELL